MRFRSAIPFCLALLFLSTGCVQVTKEATGEIFTYALWVPIAIWLGSIVGLGLGVLLLYTGWSFRFGLGLVIGSIVGAAFFGPSMLNDRIMVTSSGFEVRTGFWWSPTEYSVQFAPITRMELREERSGGRRKRTNTILDCIEKNGGITEVHVNDLMKEGALEAILQKATAAGIEIIDTR